MSPQFHLARTSRCGWSWELTDSTGDIIATSPPTTDYRSQAEADAQIALVRRLAYDATIVDHTETTA